MIGDILGMAQITYDLVRDDRNGSHLSRLKHYNNILGKDLC